MRQQAGGKQPQPQCGSSRQRSDLISTWERGSQRLERLGLFRVAQGAHGASDIVALGQEVLDQLGCNEPRRCDAVNTHMSASTEVLLRKDSPRSQIRQLSGHFE